MLPWRGGDKAGSSRPSLGVRLPLVWSLVGSLTFYWSLLVLVVSCWIPVAMNLMHLTASFLPIWYWLFVYDTILTAKLVIVKRKFNF